MAADVKKIAEWIDGKREILSSGRKNYENLCRQVTELFCPNRDDFGTQRSAGENRVRRLYNPIGIQCVEMASADLYGLLTDPSSYWFEYSFQNVNEMSDQMIVWLRRQSEIVFNLMYTPAARFAEAIAKTYPDDLVYGTDIVYISWNNKRNCPLYQNMRLSECYFDEDESGMPDTLIRCYEMTAKSMRALFGENKLPKSVKDALRDNKTDEKFKIIHAVFPNGEYDLKQVKQPFVSIIYTKDEKEVLEVSGYDEFPFAITRWETAPGEVWGRSKAMTALPDVQALQLMTKEMLEAAQLANRPALLFRKEEDKLTIPVIKPGGYIPYTDTPPQPFNAGNNYKAAQDVITNIEERIKREFALFKINDLKGTHRTREEVIQRVLEGTRLLGPVAGRQMTEKLDVILLRTFNLCARHGLLEPPPEDLPFIDLKVVYNSPIAKMMKFERADRYEQAFTLMSLFVNGNPSAMINVDTDGIVREIAKIYGVPEMLTSPEYVQATRQAQQEAAMRQQNVMDAQNALDLTQQQQNLQMQDEMMTE